MLYLHGAHDILDMGSVAGLSEAWGPGVGSHGKSSGFSWFFALQKSLHFPHGLSNIF